MQNNKINLEKLKEIKKIYLKYKKVFENGYEQEYEKFKNSSIKEEYGVGEGNNFGYYQPEYLTELIVTNNQKTKILKKKSKKIDYKYYFDKVNRLIMIESYCGLGNERYGDDHQMRYLTFYYYFKQEIHIIQLWLTNNEELISYIYKCEYNQSNMLTRYLEGTIDYYEPTLFNSFEEQLYTYKGIHLEIVKNRFHLESPFGDGEMWFKTHAYTFPISVLDKKDPKDIVKVEDIEIYNMLKNSMINIIKNWKVKNGYAISVVLSTNNFELEFNEEYDILNDPEREGATSDAERRWNIAFWDQIQGKEVLSTDEDKELFQDWLDYVDHKKNKNYSVRELQEHPVFKRIIVEVLLEIKNSGLIREVFKKDIPILLHDYEYSYPGIFLTKKVNEKELIKDFINWTIFD